MPLAKPRNSTHSSTNDCNIRHDLKREETNASMIFSRAGEKKVAFQTSSTTNTQENLSPAINQSYDTRLLRRVVADAGRWAYGTVLVEVWTLNKDRTSLFLPEGGWWVDPSFHENCGPNCQVCRLTDYTKANYVPPTPVFPGEGLPGSLWSEASTVWTRTWRESLATKILKSHERHGPTSHREVFVDVRRSPQVVWRDVRQLEVDPDSPWNPRIKLLAQLNLGWAAAVPFNLHGEEGIVIYMARSHVDREKLQSETNQSYLRAASDLIGAAYALRGPRNKVVNERLDELSETLKKVKHGILKVIRSGMTLKEFVETEAKNKDVPSFFEEKLKNRPMLSSTVRCLTSYASKTIRKAKGAGAQAPPAFNWAQTFITFAGVGSTLFIITNLNKYFAENHGSDYTLMLGPLGALVTLLFGLSAAPASQPRNALCGQALSTVIAMAISYATFFPPWFRQSLATTISISAMVKFNIVHPPAGAASMAYSSHPATWGCLGVLLTSTSIAVLMATFVNNLSDKRQYPIYWGFAPLRAFLNVAANNAFNCIKVFAKRTHMNEVGKALKSSEITTSPCDILYPVTISHMVRNPHIRDESNVLSREEELDI